MMNICPNINLPESKALIEKLGLLGFYKHYISKGYMLDEDISDSSDSVANLLFVNKDKFTAYQQSETIKSIIFQIQMYRKEGNNNAKDIVNSIKSDFVETEAYFRSDEFAGDEGALAIADNLKSVLDYFPEFIKRANLELEKTGLKISGKAIVKEDTTIQGENTDNAEESDSSYDTTEGLFQKLNYDDDSSFSQSSKDTASGDIKLALSLIPKYVYSEGKLVVDEDGSPETETNHLNLPKFEDLDSIWNDLLYTLLDVPVGSKLDYLRTSKNPKHQVIYNEIISNPKSHIQNEFEVVFSKQQANFVTVNISKADNSGNKSIQVFDTNRTNADRFIMDNWYEQFLQSGIVKTNSDGDLIINAEVGLNAREAFIYNQTLAKTDPTAAIKNITGILNNLGISISEKAFSETLDPSSRNPITGADVINTKLGYFFDRLAGLIEEQNLEDSLEYNNPFINDNSSLNLLARLENKANPTVFENSFVSGDGKAKYSFVNNSYLSLKMRKLKSDSKYVEDLAKTPYASNSYWLTQLRTNPTFKDNFGVYYTDTLGNEQTNQVNKPFKRMSTKEKEFSRVALFQNQGAGTTANNANIGYFVGLIPSDKTTIPIFKTLKVDVRVDNQLRFNNDTLDVIYDQFLSEYLRVKQTIAQTNDPNIQQIDQYHGENGAGTKFLVFRFLNNSLIVDNKLVELDDVALSQIVRPQLENFLRELTEEQISYWTSLGLYNESLFDKSYKAKKGINKNNIDLSLRQFAANYAVNQFVFMMNQTQLISGDPALHGKPSIDKTWINFYKRMAKDIAPGLDGNFKDSSFNTLFLKDLKYDSALLNEYNEKVGQIGQAYIGMNPADAQEYTTLQEHLDVMDAYGRLTEEGREAGARLLAGGTDIGDLHLVLQPVKPVYVTDKIEDNIDKMYYIKTSSFPLIPALTAGLEIDKLRVAMEANNIQRAVYESGVKLGLQGEISKISNDGYIKFKELDIKSSQVINLNREGFRIQQELPYHGHDTHISEGSQARKMILNNLEDNDDITYNGKTIKGSEAKQLFEDLHTERMDRSFNKFLSDVGFNSTLGKFNDLTKIESILKEEATLRNYPINDIYSIQLIEENDKKRFKVPLGFTNNSNRFESILNALVTNRVIKQELPGFSKVQGSAAGFSKIASLNDINDVSKSGIVWMDSKDTVLGYTKTSDGTLTGADILVPSWFHGVNMRDYIKEDGTLDTDRMPKDLLTLIGVRIPTQGYNSMMKFNVKGFLPNYMGDLAIVPAEVVVQMGSDFDVDKLFLYRYNFKQNKDGSFERLPLDVSNLSELSDSQLEDGIMQMFVDRLSDERILDQILEPNGFGTLPEVANKVADIQKGDKAVHTFTTKDQNNIHKLNNDGKAGTGIFSLFSTFNKTAQDSKLELKMPLKFKKANGDIVNVSKLWEVTGVEGQRKSSVIAYFQSAAVDNSKEQILGKLNINGETMGVAGTMGLLGLDEAFIGYFLSQPVLVDYVTRIQQANDIISGEFDPTLQSKILEDIQNKLTGKDISIADLNPILNKITYGSKELLEYLENSKDSNLNVPANLSNEEQELISKVNSLFQYKVLTDFLAIKDIADHIRAIQSAINVDTGGLGASFTALETKTSQIRSLLESSSSEGYPILNVENIFKDNIVSKATDILFKSRDIYSQILPQGSVSYTQAIEVIQKSVGLLMTEKNINDVYKNIKSYVLTSPEILNENLDDLRERLLLNKDTNIAKRWLDYSKTSAGKRNILTSRIKPRFATKRSKFNTLTALNTPASNNSIDIDNSIMYFYDMIENGTELEKDLANDLVKYYIITGAQFGPGTIGKYISYDVLEKTGFSEKLRRIEDNMNKGFILDGFIDQYFQNNPSKAKAYTLELPLDKVTIDKNDVNLQIEGAGMAGYFNYYDSKSSNFYLYKKTGKDNNGFIYEQIPVLAGSKDQIKTYNFTSIESSALADRNRIEVPVTTRSTIPTEDTLKNTYNFNDGIIPVLINITTNSKNAYFSNLANDILKNNSLSEVNLVSSNTRNANGWYNGQTNSININFDLIIKNGKELSRDKFEEVLLHETLHAISVASLTKYDNLKQSKSAATMLADNDFTREQLLGLNAINTLFEAYKNNYKDKNKLDKYIDINNRRLQGETLSDEDMDYLVSNKSELYPLINVREFVAAGLTNPDFSNTLKEGNLWTKFLDYLAKLIGINKTDLDALYTSTLSLMDVGTNNTEINDDISDESFRLTFVKQRDEFLTNHRTQIGKTMTRETLAKLVDSSKKDKYSNIKVWGWEKGNDKVELRVSRQDPIYDDISDGEFKAERNRQEQFIDRVVGKFKDNLDTLTKRQRLLGDKAPTDLSVRIEKLKTQIADLVEKQSIMSTITAAENKIDEINNALNTNNLTIDDLYEFKSYINTLINLNDHIEFEEEYQFLADRLNTIAGESVQINKKIADKSTDLLEKWIKEDLDIDFGLKVKLKRGLKDVGYLESGYLDYGQSSSDVIQSIGNLIDRAKFDANRQHDLFAAEFAPLVAEFKKKYKDYSMFLQKDSKDNPTGQLLNKFSQEFYEKAKGNFKFFAKNTKVEYSKDGQERYEKDKQLAFDNMSEEDYFTWIRLNSPVEFMKDWAKAKKPAAQGAERYVNITPIDAWIDPNYNKLKALDANDPAVKLYEFMEPIIRKTNRKYKQQSNYIPEIHKSTLDYMTSGDIKGGLGNISQSLIDSLTIELATTNTEIDEFTGELKASIPVAMYSNNLSAENKSYDLARIVEAIQYQEYMVTVKHKVEPLLNIYHYVLQDSKSIVTKPNGEEVVIDKPAAKILDQSNFLIQSFLYNKSREVQGVSDLKIGGKNIAVSKVTDSLINYVRIKGMALNPFSAIGNIMQGLTSNFISGAGGEYFTTKDQFKAFGTMLHSIAGKTSESKKIGSLIRKFDIFTKANEMNFGASREIKNTENPINNLSWFELQERGEYFIQGQTLLSLLYNNKVTLADGTVKSWYDGFDENGNWKSEFGENPLSQESDVYKFTQKIKSAIIDVHGNYTRDIKDKRKYYVRAMMIFRTWIPQAINTRFGAESIDLLTGKTKKGRYRSYNSFVRNSQGQIDLSALKDNVFWMLGAKNHTMNELDKINMRKNIAELALIATITMLILALKAGLDDLDDDEKNYTTYILNSLSRSQSDLTFFMLPSSFQTITKDPIPLMGVLDDQIDLLKAGFSTITGDPTYKVGPRKGKSRLYKEVVDNFPIINQLDKNITYATQEF